MNSVSVASPPPVSEEHRLTRLLDQARDLRQCEAEFADRFRDEHAPVASDWLGRILKAVECERVRLEQQVLELIDAHLRGELKQFLLGKLGAGAELALRYTELVNEFFVRVLKTRPDRFWQMRTLRDLRNYVSWALTNQVRDALRRKKRERAALAALEEQAVIAELAELRRDHFERHHRLDFEFALRVVEEWLGSNNLELVRRALLLRHRYVGGMTYEDIAEQLGITVSEAYQLKARALGGLRSRCGLQEHP